MGLDVLIVGAGIGGLTLAIALRQAGHTATVFEQFPQLSEVGAGIQLAPNATRVLRQLGLFSEVLKHADEPKTIIRRGYANDEELGPPADATKIREKFGDSMLAIHRADLQKVLLDAAIKLGVSIRTDAKVQRLEPDFGSSITLQNGEQFHGDVVVGADGINSRTRRALTQALGCSDTLAPTGQIAYRLMISRSALQDMPELLAEIDAGLTIRWLGPGSHCVAYPVRNKQLLNFVLLRNSTSASTDERDLWLRRGDINELRQFYAGWCPAVRGLIDRANTNDLMQWPLNERPKLPQWSINRTVLLGDACHPMLPYAAQGSAQAIEDAAAIATCLSKAPDLAQALQCYEDVRKERAEWITEKTATLKHVLHLVNGEEQQIRDAAFRAPHKPGMKNPDVWADIAFQNTVFTFDAAKQASERCAALNVA